ncbi:MAG: carbohydrate ABC transporter permease [Firmicutes bacterium]|nr:carbohydrate ABC transporter permease [Bacillota bacterium]
MRVYRRYPYMAIFGALVIVALTYIPLIFVLANSFKNAAEFANSPFALFVHFHFSNYIVAWKGVDRYLSNTVIVAIISVIIGVPAAALSSYGFAQLEFRFKGVLFYLFLGLLMIPWTLTLIPLFVEIHTFDIFNTWWALILPYAAGSQPLLIFMFRVFFEGIPEELYESARLDGCSEVGILARIVTPLSIPILLTGTILMFNSIWGDYLWPTLVLQNYHLLTISAGLETFINTFGLSAQGIGPEFAAYIIAMVPIMALVTITMKYFVSGVTSGALKA